MKISYPADLPLYSSLGLAEHDMYHKKTKKKNNNNDDFSQTRPKVDNTRHAPVIVTGSGFAV